MLSTVFDKTAGLLDKQFLVGLLLPVAGFCAALSALVLTGYGWAAPHRFWDSTSVAGRWTIGTVAAAAVLLIAVLLGTQVNRLVAMWEGYWPRWLASVGVWLQTKRYRRLGSDAGDSVRALQQYPSEETDFLPTRLGNVLLAAENYSRERYGLDSVYLWPRQYLVLSSEVRTIVDDARRAIDQLVVIATLASFSTIAAVALGIGGLMSDKVAAPAAVWVPVAAGAIIVAISAYRSAVSAATVFGDLVRSVFDLYRGELLAKLGVAAPKTRELEFRTWNALGEFLARGGTDSRDADALLEYPVAHEAPNSLVLSFRRLPRDWREPN